MSDRSNDTFADFALRVERNVHALILAELDRDDSRTDAERLATVEVILAKQLARVLRANRPGDRDAVLARVIEFAVEIAKALPDGEPAEPPTSPMPSRVM